MKVLFVDTAISGEWTYHNPPPDSAQPDMVRLAWALDEDGQTIKQACNLVKLPPDRPMETTASQFTGITAAHLSEFGRTHRSVMQAFCLALSDAELIVAFGWQHHQQVLAKELRRPDENGDSYCFEVTAPGGGVKTVGVPVIWPDALCMMKELKDILQIPNKGRAGFKLPSFNEASALILGHTMPSSRDPIINGDIRIAKIREFYKKWQTTPG
jgi:hypothetical protein